MSLFFLDISKNEIKNYKINLDNVFFKCYTKQAHSKESAIESLKTVYDEINVTLRTITIQLRIEQKN